MKKLIALLTVLVLSVAVLAGCGANNSAPAGSEAPDAKADAADADKVITVGASSTPHAEILEHPDICAEMTGSRREKRRGGHGLRAFLPAYPRTGMRSR